jgi:hypothetical protein
MAIKKLKFLISILLAFGMASLTASLTNAEVYPLYRGSRANGMGGADSAVVNDETALLVNPAALGKLRNVYGTLIDPELEVGDNARGMALESSPKSYSLPEKLVTMLDANRDIHYHYKQQYFPSIVMKNFGIGVLSKTSMDGRMSADGTRLISNYFNDSALVLGYSFRFWDGRVKIGFNVKALSRIQASGELDPATSLALKDIAKTGMGISNDAGLILTAPWAGLPTISAVVHDVGDTKFNQPGYTLKTNTRPDNITQDMDAAIAFFPINSNQARSTITLEYKNMLKATTLADPTELYHLGYELNLADIAFFRMGMNGNYWTAGAEFSTEHTQWQFSYYGQEVGLDGASEEDRRWALKFAFRF